MSAYDNTQTIEDGIERIIYRPHHPKSDVPICDAAWYVSWCMMLGKLANSAYGARLGKSRT